eukprot:g54568.t1
MFTGGGQGPTHHPHVIKEGWLLYNSTEHDSKWKKRWFQLMKTNPPRFRYFKGQPDINSEPVRSIQPVVALVVSEFQTKVPDAAFGIRIQTRSREMEVACKDEIDRDSWMAAFRKFNQELPMPKPSEIPRGYR